MGGARLFGVHAALAFKPGFKPLRAARSIHQVLNARHKRIARRTPGGFLHHSEKPHA